MLILIWLAGDSKKTNSNTKNRSQIRSRRLAGDSKHTKTNTNTNTKQLGVKSEVGDSPRRVSPPP